MRGGYHWRPEPLRPVSSFVGLGARGALTLLVPALLAAQNPGTGVVAGRVTTRADSGAAPPAHGAVVSIVGTTLGATADADGRFLVEQVPAGAFTLRVRMLGYRTAERALRVRGLDTVRIDITLQTDAQLLAPVRTNARATDVEMFLTKPNIAAVNMSAAAMAGVPSVG